MSPQLEIGAGRLPAQFPEQQHTLSETKSLFPSFEATYLVVRQSCFAAKQLEPTTKSFEICAKMLFVW